MKVNEIFNSISNKNDIRDILDKLVDKHGLNLFNGQHAYVIPSRTGKFVYRIWGKDPGFEQWMHIALTMQNNPHIVKILNKIRTIEDARFGPHWSAKILKLEMLAPITDPALSEAITFMDATKFSYSFSNLKNMNVDDFINATTDIRNAETSYLDKISQHAIEFLHNNKNFVETFLTLVKMGYNDMHSNNILMRDNVPVIVDPLGWID